MGGDRKILAGLLATSVLTSLRHSGAKGTPTVCYYSHYLFETGTQDEAQRYLVTNGGLVPLFAKLRIFCGCRHSFAL
jgi:hypothetical protein